MSGLLPRPKPAHVAPIKARDLQVMLAIHSGLARYLFVHIPKNAGVAMRRAPELRWRMVGVQKQMLRDRAYLRDLLQAMGAEGEHHGIAHARLRDVKTALARKLRPVAVLRNPWARVVSRYRFGQAAVRNGLIPEQEHLASFDAFLDSRLRDGGRPFFWHRAIRGWYPQLDYVVDAEGRIAADLLRQEYLEDDARSYFGMSGGLRRRNVTVQASTPWQSFYTPATIRIVADWYRADIEAFGFDFDKPAMRNIVAAIG